LYFCVTNEQEPAPFVNKKMSFTRLFDPRTAEELQIQQGIIRKSAITRSLDFKRNYHAWIRANRHQLAFSQFQQAFDALFYGNSDCKVEVTDRRGCITYIRPVDVEVAEHLYLLDLLKEQFSRLDFVPCKAEGWKRLEPELGVEVHQRYLLRKSKNAFLSRWFGKWMKGDLLVLEFVYIDKVTHKLEIRFYPDFKNPAHKSVYGLMEALYKTKLP